MNNVTLIGRLVRDPELKYIQGSGTPVANFTIAVDRMNKEQEQTADFIPVVVFGKIAEATVNYVDKGKLIGIDGRLQIRTYDGNEGTRHYVTEVVAEKVHFLQWKEEQPPAEQPKQQPKKSYSKKK